MGSPQTLSEADRRIVAAWAADCAERVLGLFEAEAPGDSRPRDALARLRAFVRGELGVAATGLLASGLLGTIIRELQVGLKGAPLPAASRPGIGA